MPAYECAPRHLEATAMISGMVQTQAGKPADCGEPARETSARLIVPARSVNWPRLMKSRKPSDSHETTSVSVWGLQAGIRHP